MFDTFSKNLPASFKIFLSNFENCKFCQREGLAPLESELWLHLTLVCEVWGRMWSLVCFRLVTLGPKH